MEKNIDIIYENDNIIVLNKDSGKLNLADNDLKEEPTLFDDVKKFFGDIFPLTSLVKDASGLVIFAKDKQTYDFLSKQFEDGNVNKTYHILVNGIIEEEQGEINKKLIVDKDNTSISDKGIIALTKYKVLEQFKNFAFVEALPITTHKNQIRAHFWSLGNPLAIDEVYATSEPIMLSNLKRRYKGLEREKPLLARLPLHLSKIELLLPNKKETSTFESELPKDLIITLKQLRKYNKRG